MSTRQNRNRTAFRLEMLETRTALSHMGLPSSGGHDAIGLHSEHHRGHHAEVQLTHNQRGRNDGNNQVANNQGNPGPGQDNRPGDNQRGRNDGNNQVANNQGNPGPGQDDAPGHDLGDDRGGPGNNQDDVSGHDMKDNRGGHH